MKSHSASPSPLVPAVLADAVAVLALFGAFPALSSRFNHPGGSNALLLSAGFLLFCFGVYGLRRLPPASGEWASRRWRTALALFFAFVISLAIAWQLGFFDSGLLVDTRELGEGGSAAYFVFAPGAWLVFSLLYVLVLAFGVRSTMESTGGLAVAYATFGLLAANVMLVLLSAQARVLVGGAGWLLPAYLGLLLLFAPPRLIYIARTTRFPSPTAYMILGLFLVVVGAYALGIITV